MRLLVIILLLAGCTPLTGGQIKDTKGEPIEIAYVFMQPFCLIFCTTTLSTTGTDSDVIGSGSASTSASTSQTVSTTGGGN